VQVHCPGATDNAARIPLVRSLRSSACAAVLLQRKAIDHVRIALMRRIFFFSHPQNRLSVCGFSQWNPDDITLVPSMNLLLTLRMRPRMVTSPAWDDREQPGIYSVPLPESVGDPSSYRRLPTHIWPLGRPSDVGRLLTTDTQCTGPPIGSPFYPHALSAYVSTSCSGSSAASPARLFVVVSSELRDSIEWFDIVSSAKGPVMSWVGCTQLPPGTFLRTSFIFHPSCLSVSMVQKASQ